MFFSSLPIDHAHEQNNKSVKGDGGAIGLTENMFELLRWMVAGPEIASLILEFEASQEFIKADRDQEPNKLHHEQAIGVQAKFSKQVSELCRVIGAMGNLFCEDSNDVLVLDTGNIVDKKVALTVKTIQQKGQEQFQRFVQHRLDTKYVSLFAPVKKNNLPRFSCPPLKKCAR